MILTTHTDKKGNPKLVDDCEFPLTAQGTVNRVITDLAVISIDEDGFKVEEMIAGMTQEELQAKTGAKLRFSENLKVLEVPAV